MPRIYIYQTANIFYDSNIKECEIMKWKVFLGHKFYGNIFRSHIYEKRMRKLNVSFRLLDIGLK